MNQPGPHLAVLDASPNAIIAVDASGRLTYANPEVERTFGFRRDELIGQQIEILVPDGIRDRHVAHREDLLSDPHPRPMGVGLDLTARRKDGSVFPVEISLTPVAMTDGLQVFATIVDISARVSVLAALAESERRLRVALEASPNVVVAVDSKGILTYVNPRTETAFGYGRDELIGQPIERLLPDRLLDRHVEHRNGFLANPVARPMGIGLDLSARRKDGSEFPVEISLAPVETADGVQVFATVVDITARKLSENQLLQAQKLESIGRLAGGIAHDFNNLLFAISGYAEILAQTLGDPGPAEFDRVEALQHVQAIRHGAERATALTAQLLAFGRRQIVMERVLDMNARIHAIEPMLRPIIGERVRLVMRLDPMTGRIQADPGQLDQILVNLVVNARDAMPDGGTVTIETSNVTFDSTYAADHQEVGAGRYVLLAISDTGVGMSAATREHIFEPFFTTKEVGKGTGLGLATIYGIVRQAGGHIWLYSEPGMGSTFKLYFPQEDAPAVEPEPLPAVEAAPRTGTILVAEDDSAVRRLTTILLERAGYRVIPVSDAMEALTVVESLGGAIDVLVTDVVMPGMSGIELAERMMSRSPKIGVVLLSGYTAETLDLARITAEGAIFISKPVTSADLLDATARAMPERETS